MQRIEPVTKTNCVLCSVFLMAVSIQGCRPRHHADDDGGSQQPDASQPDDGSTPYDGGDTPDAGAPDAQLPDGQTPDDAGHPEPDADMPMDAGHEPDAQNPEDAGPPDGGGAIDECGEAERHVLGSASSPVEVPLASMPFEEIVDRRGLAFLRVTGLTIGEEYWVELIGPRLIQLFLSETGTGFTEAICQGAYVGSTPDYVQCSFAATASSIDVAIDAFDDTAPFTLDVRPLVGPDGTGAASRQLVLDDFPYVSPTTFQGVYELSGLTPGQEYSVTVTSLDAPISVVVYPTRGGVPSFYKAGTLKARGYGTPPATTMLVTVQGRPTEATFEIDVTPSTYVSEGTIAAPIAIDEASELPYEGSIGSGRMFFRPPTVVRAESVYAIEGLEPGGYSVKLSGPDGTLLGVFGDDATFNTSTMYCSASASLDGLAECGARITGTTLYVKVYNGESGTPFTLELGELPFVNEGTPDAPIPVASSALPLQGEFEARGTSEYEITGLTAGQEYLASFADVNDAIAFAAISEGGSELCRIHSLTEPTLCRVTPSSATLTVSVGLYEPLRPGYAVGSRFALDLQPYVNEGEGTAEEPLVIACSGPAIEARLPALGASFYEVTGIAPGVPYIVEVRGVASVGMLTVAPGQSAEPFGTDYCADVYPGESARCVVTSEEDRIFVRVAASLPQTFELSVRPLASGSEGSVASPVELTLDDQPYSGTVASAARGYYAITGLTPGASYLIGFQGALEDVFIETFAEAAFETSLNWSSAEPMQSGAVPLDATGETGYFTVWLRPEDDGVTDFTVNVTLVE
jgi:hypothetical protein